jgi:hypothetical protein
MIVIHLFYFASRVALIGTPDSHVTATPFSGDAGINPLSQSISKQFASTFFCFVA